MTKLQHYDRWVLYVTNDTAYFGGYDFVSGNERQLKLKMYRHSTHIPKCMWIAEWAKEVLAKEP